AGQDQRVLGAHGERVERVDPLPSGELLVAAPGPASLAGTHAGLLDAVVAREVAARGQVADPDVDLAGRQREAGLLPRAHGVVRLPGDCRNLQDRLLRCRCRPADADGLTVPTKRSGPVVRRRAHSARVTAARSRTGGARV